jgi:hypothetical protein
MLCFDVMLIDTIEKKRDNHKEELRDGCKKFS